MSVPVSIYALKDPRSDVIRYIGKTRNVDRRYREHCFYGSPNRRMREWIVELSTEGLLPVICVLEITTLANAEERERHWIGQVKQTGQLLNVR